MASVGRGWIPGFYLSSTFNYSVLILGACVKVLVFIELLILRVRIVDVCNLGRLSSSLDTLWTSCSCQCAWAKECKHRWSVELPRAPGALFPGVNHAAPCSFIPDLKEGFV